MERRSFLIASLGAGVAMAARAAPNPDTIAVSTQGRVRGRLADGVYSFKGVPFAAPLSGLSRFLPPEPAPSWEGTRDALSFGPKPPQGAYPPIVAPLIPPELTPWGDDCLTLNIWTPSLASDQLPVMFWIAGGLYEYHATGASPWYDGSSFARDGVVLVSINYRIGAEGFLFLNDGVSNLGLLDQIAALQWVRENIASFGGNPDNVTIFGESAGGLAVGTLLAVPRAKGLFRRAIVESGGGQHVTSPATAERIGRRFAELANVSAERKIIGQLPTVEVIAAQDALRAELLAKPDPGLWGEVLATGLPWQPTVDGEVLPAAPLDAVRNGASEGVDLLLGSNTEEWRLFLVPGNVIDQIPAEAAAGALAGFGLDPQAALAAYGKLHPNAGPGDLFAEVMTDWYWRIPALRLAEAHAARSNGAGTYAYEFGWRSPQFDGRLGAGHAIEIPFVFDTLGPSSAPLLGDNPPRQLADAMHRAWVDFATSGNPGWPPFTQDQHVAMHFDAISKVIPSLLGTESVIWRGVR